MSFVAAAVIGAGGAIAGAGINAYASGKASSQQQALGQQALGQQNALFQQGLQLEQPFVQAGQQGIPALNSFLDPESGLLGTIKKLLTPGADQTETLSNLPGFKFAQDWGQKAVQNIGTTTGLGGNVLKAGADYATGAAQQGFGSLVQLLTSAFGTGANALQGRVNGGANAAANIFGNATQTGANTGNTLTGIGNAQAAGTLGTANALSGGINGASGNITNALLLQKLLGPGGGNQSYNGIYTDPKAAGTLNATDPGNI